MPIPDLESFNQLLATLTLRQSTDGAAAERLEVVPSRILSDTATFGASEPICLSYQPTPSLSIERLLERVSKELATKGHFSSLALAKNVVAVLFLATDEVPSITRLNALLDYVAPADTSQFLIAPFPPHPDTRAFQLGRFSIGPLNRERLEYRCRRVQCDFFDRYPDRFSRRFAIEGGATTVQVLDFPTIFDAFRIYPNDVATTVIDHYFELVSRELQRMFREEFKQGQEVLVAAGAPYVDVDSPTAWNGGAFVCVFQNIGPDHAGYFCPLGMGASVDYAQADRRIPLKIEELRATYGFDGIEEYEIHKTLRTYCRFVTRAKIYEGEGRIEEGFLHSVIALDLVLGEKDASNDRITRRTAIIVAPAIGVSYRGVVDQMRRVYDRRSRYVHKGEGVPDGALTDIKPVIDEVLKCLLRLQAAPDVRAQWDISKWLKTLDYLAAAADAGLELDPVALVGAGIVAK